MTEQGETTNLHHKQQTEQRRRSVSSRVRQVRERLTSQTGTNPAFDRDLILAYARNQAGIALVVPLLAVIIAGMTTVWIPWAEATVWLAGVLISNGILTYLCRRYEYGAPYKMSARLWERRFFAAEFLNGVMWATMAFLSVPNGQTEPIIFMFAVLIVILAMRTLTASNLPLASLAGTLPITAAIILRFSMYGEPVYFAMAGLAFGAQIFFMIIARQLHSTVLAMFGLRKEKDALIGELEQATALSDEARRRAEEANLAKSRFLATMSHELRTPLNAILGFSEVLKDEIIGRHAVPAYKEYSGDIHRSGQHLLELINEILDLSRIEAGRYGLHEEAVSLPGTVQDCHHLMKLRADQRDIRIEEVFEEDLPKIWVDERAVRQIVLNLLTNAIKFSPNGSLVTLTVGWTSGGGQYLSVKDSGPGIPEDEIPTVLETFGRGSLAAKNAEEGSGLGLPIVMKLVELHGGRFDLQSKLREGTEATVIFPRERVMKALPPLDDDREPGSRRRSAA
jgi:two-component system, cell cycle sensor histidine kinase PleC